MSGQLSRVRWGVRGVLTLGVAASVAANILHALPNPISQGIAAWPPLALLITIELVAKVPAQSRKAVAARIAATVTIAGIAAWVSYWHMAGVAARYGEDRIAAHLLPLSVDGLIVVASVSLVEIAQRIRAMEDAPAEAPAQRVQPASREADDAQQPSPVFAPEPGRCATARCEPDRIAQRVDALKACAAGEGTTEILRRWNGDAPSRRTVENWTRDLRALPVEARAAKLAELLHMIGAAQ